MSHVSRVDSPEGLLSGKRAEVVKEMKDLEALATVGPPLPLSCT